MHCFGCCPFSPCDVSDIAHEETPIVSSCIVGNFDPSYSLHDPNSYVHHMLPIYDDYDDCHEESISCDAMLHRISCGNSLGHIMFANPLDLSYAMHEIHHMSYLQSLHSDYAYAIKINPICTYGIDDKPMVIGICFFL